MKIYLKNQSGVNTFFTDLQAQSHARESCISDPLVDITVGDERIFFYPTDYDVVGFSLDAKELTALLQEATAHEERTVAAVAPTSKATIVGPA